MSTIQPEGENLRKAIRWIAEETHDSPSRTRKALVADACLKFNLTPMESEFLLRHDWTAETSCPSEN